MVKISKSRVVWSINETQSMRQASKLLGVSYNTFKKYAKLYEVWSPLDSAVVSVLLILRDLNPWNWKIYLVVNIRVIVTLNYYTDVLEKDISRKSVVIVDMTNIELLICLNLLCWIT